MQPRAGMPLHTAKGTIARATNGRTPARWERIMEKPAIEKSRDRRDRAIKS
jgi:hypothetical protein